MNNAVKDFISKANQIHNYKFDYSLVKYTNSKTKITIICPIHGKFEQTPNGHLNSYGCKLCAKEIIKNKVTNTNEDFIKQSKRTHGNKYDYSKVKYVNNRSKVTIICPERGEFKLHTIIQ